MSTHSLDNQPDMVIADNQTERQTERQTDRQTDLWTAGAEELFAAKLPLNADDTPPPTPPTAYANQPHYYSLYPVNYLALL